MKDLHSAALICLLLLLQPTKAAVLQSGSPEFDPNLFRLAAHLELHGKVKGYQMAIVRNKTLVGIAAGGFAVDHNDTMDPMPMNVSVPMDVGSTVKMVSTVALLSTFEADTSKTVEQWLDENFLDYMPELWRTTLLGSSDPWKQAVGDVTFRDLLQHRSGLNVADDSGKKSGDFFNGVNPDAIGTGDRKYDNNNITMLRYTLPYIVDPQWAQDLDQSVEEQNISDLTDPYIGIELRRWFHDYMQAEVFDKVTITKSQDITLPPGEWSSRLKPECSHQAYVTSPIFSNLQFGEQGYQPLVGDMDGDGTDDFVLWHPSMGKWFVRSWSKGFLLIDFPFGISGDRPLVGDVDGDGADDLVIWRPSSGQWIAKNLNGDSIKILNFTGFGSEGDIPFLRNVDDDKGNDELIIYRPSNHKWYARKFNGEAVWGGQTFALDGNYEPFLADADGDQIFGPVAWRPEEGEFEAALMSGTQSEGTRTVSWGTAEHIFLVGDIDGDTREEFVLFRQSDHRWWGREFGFALFKQLQWSTGQVVPFLGDVDGDGQDDLITYRPDTYRWSAAGRRNALGYSNKDATNGIPKKQLEDPCDECNSAGGYWFSAAEYAAWAGTFGFGDAFVSQAVRDLMWDDSTAESRKNRLGWWYAPDLAAEGHSFLEDTYGIRFLPIHGGTHWNFRSAFIQLPDGYYGFVTANSPELGEKPLAKSLLRAWITAMGGTAQEGGVDFSALYNVVIEYVEERGELPEGWQEMLAVAPALRISHQGASVLLAWPNSATGFELQQTHSLTVPDWTAVPNPPVVVGDESQVVAPLNAGGQLYRLYRP